LIRDGFWLPQGIGRKPSIGDNPIQQSYHFADSTCGERPAVYFQGLFLKSIEIQREQARLRQSRKRQRHREARLDVQASTMADQMPAAWHKEWLERVRRARACKERARAEVERTSALIPESGRADFAARNRPNTKVSLTELRNCFTREKLKAKQAAENSHSAEYDDGYPEDWRPPRHEIELLDGTALCLERLQPGDWGWWLIACSGKGGLSDKRVRGYRIEGDRCCTVAGGVRPFNPPAMAWQRAERLFAAACVCHDACVTSRPEYWLVASARPPSRIFSGRT
jgi:hypothetical protein